MIERYDDRCTGMRFHTDQAQDLAPESSIHIFSCYPPHIAADDVRCLVIKDKETSEQKTIELAHGSVVSMTLDANRRFLHKIVGWAPWIGMTFRQSGTFIDGAGCVFGQPLRMATDDEKKETYLLKAHENASVEFAWPELHHTLSPGDMMKWRG